MCVVKNINTRCITIILYIIVSVYCSVNPRRSSLFQIVYRCHNSNTNNTINSTRVVLLSRGL